MNDIQNYIKNNLLGEVEKLQASGFHYVSFIIISQAIEILGSFLDSKPIRAQRQSRRRYRLAINNLFASKYKRINRDDWLYDKLRNHLTHSFIPSSWIILSSRKSSEGRAHLESVEGKIVFVSEDFFEDFKKACNKIISMIERGEIKSKKLPMELISRSY